MTAETFARCLAETLVGISSDSDIHALAPGPREHPFAEKTEFLYAYLMGKMSRISTIGWRRLRANMASKFTVKLHR